MFLPQIEVNIKSIHIRKRNDLSILPIPISDDMSFSWLLRLSLTYNFLSLFLSNCLLCVITAYSLSKSFPTRIKLLRNHYLVLLARICSTLT